LTLEQTELHRGVVRRLFPADLNEFKGHLLRLGPTSRRERFGMAVSDDFLTQYTDRCFGIDDVIYGYVEDGVVRGAGELRGIGHNLPVGFGGSAEAAFSVEKNWRRRGIGAELMGRIVRSARNRRADTLYMSCLVSNKPMLNLARKFSAELRCETDESQGGKPSSSQGIDDLGDDLDGFATAMVDLNRRTFAIAR
jgi:GNAT superfamily N-acetyltransferase